MTGKILGFDTTSNTGTISGDNGERYKFTLSEWKAEINPKANQKIDFDFSEKNAQEIYLVGSNFNTDEVLESAKEKLSNIKESEYFITMMNKKNEILLRGVQYKYGFVLTIMLILAYFLPVIDVPFVGAFSLWNGKLGTYVILLLLFLAFLFYSGGKALTIKITTAIIMLMMFSQFYDLGSTLMDTNSFMEMGMMSRHHNKGDIALSLLRFGILIIIPLTILVGFAGLFKKERSL